MRYMLLLHSREEDVHATAPERVEQVTSFLATFDDRLLQHSELDWTEVLGSELNAETVEPSGVVRDGWVNAAGLPIARIWVVRVADEGRARAIAAELAAGTGSTIEVRACMPSAQRP